MKRETSQITKHVHKRQTIVKYRSFFGKKPKRNKKPKTKKKKKAIPAKP